MKYKFKNGLPKIHAHDNKNSQAFGLIKKGATHMSIYI